MKKSPSATTIAVGASIAVFSLLTILSAQSRDELLLAVSSADSTLAILKVDGRALTLLATVPSARVHARKCACRRTESARTSRMTRTTAARPSTWKPGRDCDHSAPEIKHAEGCAESPDGKKLYVAGMDSETWPSFRWQRHQLLKTIAMGKEPRRFLFTPDGRRVYVTSEDGKTIRILDVASDKIVGSFESGGDGPRVLVALPDQKTLLIANVDDDSASLINIATKKPKLNIGVGGSPQRVEISRDGAWAYFLSVIERKISAVDLKGPHVRAKKFASIGAPLWHGDERRRLTALHLAARRQPVVVFDTAAINAITLPRRTSK